MQREVRGGGLRRRMLGTVLPAAIGTFAGYTYARLQLDAETLRRMVGMYAAAGAAIGILVVRIGTLFWTMFSDYFQKSE